MVSEVLHFCRELGLQLVDSPEDEVVTYEADEYCEGCDEVGRQQKGKFYTNFSTPSWKTFLTIGA